MALLREAARLAVPEAVLDAWAARRVARAQARAVQDAAGAPAGPLAPLAVPVDDRPLTTGDVAVVAHYDPDGGVAGYVRQHLRALRDEGFAVVLVSNSPLDDEGVDRLRGLADVVAVRANRGYDFGAWQTGLSLLDLTSLRRVLLVNDSVYGPVAPLAPLLQRMTPEAADVWGLTEALRPHPHLQSYFLLLHRAALVHPELARFWAQLRLVDDKTSVVLTHEVGLSRTLAGAGLRLRALVPMSALRQDAASWAAEPGIGPAERRLRRRLVRGTWGGARPMNVTHHLWRELLAGHDFPYVKRELLRDNPTRRPGVDDWRAELTRAPAWQQLIDDDLVRRRR